MIIKCINYNKFSLDYLRLQLQYLITDYNCKQFYGGNTNERKS